MTPYQHWWLTHKAATELKEQLGDLLSNISKIYILNINPNKEQDKEYLRNVLASIQEELGGLNQQENQQEIRRTLNNIEKYTMEYTLPQKSQKTKTVIIEEAVTHRNTPYTRRKGSEDSSRKPYRQ